MAKVSKEFEWRMQGMLYAYKIAKEQGIDALEADIRMRNFLKAPLNISKQEIDKFKIYLSENLYHTMLTVTLMVLHDHLGFAKKRLLDFKKKFDDMTQTVFDFDRMGQHYITLEDYAVYLNEKADLGLDVARIANCQETYSYEKEWKNMVEIGNLIKALQENGFDSAATWLQERIS